jgi:hypothetical protein
MLINKKSIFNFHLVKGKGLQLNIAHLNVKIFIYIVITLSFKYHILTWKTWKLKSKSILMQNLSLKRVITWENLLLTSSQTSFEVDWNFSIKESHIREMMTIHFFAKIKKQIVAKEDLLVYCWISILSASILYHFFPDLHFHFRMLKRSMEYSDHQSQL